MGKVYGNSGLSYNTVYISNVLDNTFWRINKQYTLSLFSNTSMYKYVTLDKPPRALTLVIQESIVFPTLIHEPNIKHTHIHTSGGGSETSPLAPLFYNGDSLKKLNCVTDNWSVTYTVLPLIYKFYHVVELIASVCYTYNPEFGLVQ